MRFNQRGPGELSSTVEARLFRRRKHSAKVECVVCGAIGYPGCPWQRPHRRGHAPCLSCGRQLTLRLDGTPRIHARCPKAD